MEIRVDKSFLSEAINVYVLDRGSDHRASLAVSMTMEKMKEGAMFPQPTFSIERREAQALMDELWQCGLRPSEGTGSAGAFAAQGKHLQDMRQLVFKEKLK